MNERDRTEAEATRRWISARFGVDETEPKTVIPNPDKSGNGRKIHPCAPVDYNGPVALDGWPIGEVAPKIPY